MPHRLRPILAFALPGGVGHLRSLMCAVAVAGALVACSDPPPDPDEARRTRVETRLRDSFSANQASCILERIDEPTLVALDRAGDLDADSDAMATYSEAVVGCVTDPGGTPDYN